MLAVLAPGAGKFNIVNFCALSLESFVMSVPCLCSITRLIMATNVELPMNARAIKEVREETFHFADMVISGLYFCEVILLFGKGSIGVFYKVT